LEDSSAEYIYRVNFIDPRYDQGTQVMGHRVAPFNREKGLAEVIELASCALTESILKRTGRHRLRTIEWRILAVLGKRDGLLMTELGERSLVRQPTLSKAIDRMAAAQLVRRRTPRNDHRRSLVHLTERGMQLATQVVLNIRQHEALIARVCGKAPIRKLRVELIRLITLVERVPPWAMREGAQGVLSDREDGAEK
jgi:MarR family transcriptional regulator, lower aerobic nicotinate degradation pathway regulator